MKQVQDYIRTIPDFPHEGIMFRDVTTLFADPRGFRLAIDQMLHPYVGIQIDKVVGLEARASSLAVPSHTNCLLDSSQFANKENCRARQFPKPTHSNMVKPSWNCTTMRSNRVKKS